MPVSNEFVSGTIGVEGATITTTSYLQPQKQTYASVRFNVENRSKRVKSYYPQPNRLSTNTFTYESTLETIDESELFVFSEEKGFGMWTPELATGGGAGSGGSAQRVPVSTSWTPTKNYVGDVLIIGIPGAGGGGSAGYPGSAGETITNSMFSLPNPFGIAPAGRGGRGGTAGGQGSDYGCYQYIKDASFTALHSYAISIPTASMGGAGGLPDVWRNISGTAVANTRQRSGWSSPSNGTPAGQSPMTYEADVSIGSYSVRGGLRGSTNDANAQGTSGGWFQSLSSGFTLSGTYWPAIPFFNLRPPRLTRKVIDIQDGSTLYTETVDLPAPNLDVTHITENTNTYDTRNCREAIRYGESYYQSTSNVSLALSIPGTGGYPGRCWNLSYTNLTSSVPLYMGYTMLRLEPPEEGEAVDAFYNLFWIPTTFLNEDVEFEYVDEGETMKVGIEGLLGIGGTNALSGAIDNLQHSTSSVENRLKFNIRSEYSTYDIDSPEAAALGLAIPEWEPLERRSKIVLLRKPFPPIVGGSGGAGGFGGCGGQGGIVDSETYEPAGGYIRTSVTVWGPEPGSAYPGTGLPIVNGHYVYYPREVPTPGDPVCPETTHLMTDDELKWCAKYYAPLYDIWYVGFKYWPENIPSTSLWKYGSPGEPAPENAHWCSGSRGDKGTEGAIYIFNLRPA